MMADDPGLQNTDCSDDGTGTELGEELDPIARLRSGGGNEVESDGSVMSPGELKYSDRKSVV